MKLTVITPVYNSIKHIENCILNVLEQNCLTELEHLIMDGGSSDGTVDVIRKYADQYPHIHWISEKDEGQSDAMNKALKIAKGEYLGFLNVDDYYEKNTIKEFFHQIKLANYPDFIMGDCNVRNEDRELIYINRPRKIKPWHLLSMYYLPVNPSSYFYKKEIHQKIGYYNINNHYNMDMEFLIQMSFISRSVYVPHLWGNFVISADTKTGSDQLNGMLTKRKEELVNKYLKEASCKVRFLTKGVCFSMKIKQEIRVLKKLIRLPFNMIYWKTRKILKN